MHTTTDLDSNLQPHFVQFSAAKRIFHNDHSHFTEIQSAHIFDHCADCSFEFALEAENIIHSAIDDLVFTFALCDTCCETFDVCDAETQDRLVKAFASKESERL